MPKNVFVFPDTAQRDIDVIVAVPKMYVVGGNKYPIFVREKDINVAPPHANARLVINFEIYYVDNVNVYHIVYDIKPHFELWVGYYESEAATHLQFYDTTLPTGPAWVNMGADHAFNPHPTPAPHKYEGYGYVKRSTWGDPNVGWV